MIPVHATATATPQQLRWVVPAEHLPGRGRVRRAPGQLGALMDGGVITSMQVRADDVLITLAPDDDWRAYGDDVRRALCDALTDHDGWQVDAPDAASLADVTAELLAGPVGTLAASHGGSIELLAVDGDVVTVRLAGACHGCPSAAGTLHDALEQQLRRQTGRPVTVRSESDSAARPLGRKLLSLFVR